MIRSPRHLFESQFEFIANVDTPERIIPGDKPEIAFLGRSNVGKSTLINTLTRQPSLARTSTTPGRTQALIFFENSAGLRLVDMPGYGYARASKKDIRRWQKLSRLYLQERRALARLILLIDSRRGLQEVDHEMMKELDQWGVSYCVVLTKADKLKKEAQAKVMTETVEGLKRHPAAYPEPILTSAKKAYNLKALQAYIYEAVAALL